MYTFVVVVYACLLNTEKSCSFYQKRIDTRWEIECLVQLEKEMVWFRDINVSYAKGTCVGPLKIDE